MTEPTNQADPVLEQALERARTTKPAGPGLNKGTLALGGLILAGGGFLGGYLVGGHGPNDQAGPGNMVIRGEGPGGPGGMPANLTMGTIESISGNTFTVKTESGETVDVEVVDNTTIRINKEGSIGDLAEGDNVVVNGQRDGDTIEAENIGSGMMLRGGGPDRAGG